MLSCLFWLADRKLASRPIDQHQTCFSRMNVDLSLGDQLLAVVLFSTSLLVMDGLSQASQPCLLMLD